MSNNIEVVKLKNGMTVLLDRIEGISSASLGVFVKTGAKNELEGEGGISHFLEHMMFKGTTTRSAKEISEAIDNVGGIINAYTSKEITSYYVQMLSNRLDIGIDILTDMFLNSTFTNENMEKERNVIIEEIRMYEDIPEEVVHERNATFAMEGVQSNIILGSIQSVEGITREKLVKYFKEQYRTNNMVISVAGNFNKDEIIERLNAGFGTIEANDFQREYNGALNINSGENLIKKDTNQIHLCFNTISEASKSEKKYEASIISNTLGGNMSSRLFQKIREEKGLAYSVYCYNSSYEEGGMLTVYAGTTEKDYKEVIEIIKEEFRDLKENGITEGELQKSKNQFLSSVTFGLESSRGRMTRMANSYLFYNEVRDLEKILDEIEKITVEDIKELANKIFDEKYYSLTVMGNIQ